MVAERESDEWYVTKGAPYIAIGQDGPVYGVVSFHIGTSTEQYFEYARIMAASREMLAACQAAERYFQSVCGRAASGEVSLLENGGGVVKGEELNALFDDWVRKTKLALAKVTE